jgi:lysophospholipase L1-like esterase
MHTKLRIPGILYAAVVAAFAVCSVRPAFAETPAPATAIKPIKPFKIILVGDSTVAVQSGWGGSFCADHVTSSAACLNLARGGRSSSSYFEEGSWAVAMSEAKVSGYVKTWVLIQFGHNDQPGKPGRSTDLATGYPRYLERYVNEARSAGAVPVLVTPLTRRLFSHGTLRNDLAPWADAMKRVANDLHVPVIDLNALSSAAVQAMGPTEANKLAQRPPSAAVAAAAARGTTIGETSEPDAAPAPTPVPGMAQSKLAFDYTHLGRAGSDYFAAMIAAELAKQVPDMKQLLVP